MCSAPITLLLDGPFALHLERFFRYPTSLRTPEWTPEEEGLCLRAAWAPGAQQQGVTEWPEGRLEEELHGALGSLMAHPEHV